MQDWITIISFTYPHEAHLPKGILEAEGIKVIITDELTAQVNNFYSTAIGGVKLKVHISEYENATQILIDAGYIKAEEFSESQSTAKINQLTEKIPFLRKLIPEIRLVFVITSIISIIGSLIALFSIPSDQEILTGHTWCVERIYLHGEPLIEFQRETSDSKSFSNCFDLMSFANSGIARLPYLDSYYNDCEWEIVDDKLVISDRYNSKIMITQQETELLGLENNTQQSFFPGEYFFNIEDNILILKSDSITIAATIFSKNYSK